MARMSAAKDDINKRQETLLEARYDLSDRPAPGATMSRSKPLQQGVRVKLAQGITWDELAKLTPDQIKARDIFPAGFLPLPHPNYPEGGMLFPKAEIDEIKKQEDRDVARFDLDFDIPDQTVGTAVLSQVRLHLRLIRRRSAWSYAGGDISLAAVAEFLSTRHQYLYS
jgi:cytochrome c peroxidase